MRIRTAIFAVYVAASAVGFAVLMRFMLAEVRPRYITAVRLNLADTGRVLSRALAGRTVAGVQTALAGSASFQAKLIAADGRVLLEKRAADPGMPSRYSVLSGELIDERTSPSDTEVSAEEPVLLADGTKARLVLSRSFRSVNEVIWTERKKLAGVGLLVAGVMVVAGWWIAARLTDSLERLTVYAQGVRDGRPVAPPGSRATEIAALGRAFEEMRDALEGRHQVERYTQALAHEVKAPLAAIRGAAELMDEAMPAAQRTKFLGNIRREAARIQQLVERLLELSSLEARKALGRTEPVAAADLLREAAAVVQPAAEAARVTLTVAAVPATVRGEPVLLREALVNLLQNALDFSPAGGTVASVVSVADGEVVFTVDDGGPGVPDYALLRVFERFYSLPRPGSTRKSTGLGLALVREIAHLHGGTVTLANRSAGGARATLHLPARA